MKGKQLTTSGGWELDLPALFCCLLEMTRAEVVGLGDSWTEVGSLVDGEGDSKGRGSGDGRWDAAGGGPERPSGTRIEVPPVVFLAVSFCLFFLTI